MSFLNSLKRQFKSVQVKYLGGHPDLTITGKVGLEEDGENISICAGAKWEPVLIIPKENIIHLTLEQSDARSLGKAATGAVIGGVLTGGVGAVAGAAIGGRKKDTSVIVMTVQYGKSTVDLLFSGDDAKTSYTLMSRLLK